MYGKIFESIYDGTLRMDWKAMIVFQQLIVLADKDGYIDMTQYALHARTGIPLDIIEYGLGVLSAPDDRSRSEDKDGRRLLLLDEHRDWGWQIVNYAYYRDLASQEDRREKARIRKQNQRDKDKSVTGHASSRMSRHTDVDVDVDVDINPPIPPWLDQIAWNEFVQHRKDIKKPLTKLAAKKNMNILKEYPDQQKEIIDRTIANRWTGLFSPDPKGARNGQGGKLSAVERVNKAIMDKNGNSVSGNSKPINGTSSRPVLEEDD